MKKTAPISVIIILLVLIQSSFLAHFKFFGININIILISVIAFNVLESEKKFWGIFAAIIGGLFWDIFSTLPFGFHSLILVLIALIIKIIFRQYVRIPIFERA